MGTHSDITKRFLLAAKHQEIQALNQLSCNCKTVGAIKDMIHELQRERGISNVVLGSKGERFSLQREAQLVASNQREQDLRSLLKSLYLGKHDHGQSMRLLSSITFALQGLDNLPELRNKISALKIKTLASTNAYCRLIAGLLDVIFEAADVASDPEMTRLLVALFNFMQGKEYAGQERAWGAIGFAESEFTHELCDRLTALIDSQQQCFETFSNFADDEELTLWQHLSNSEIASNIKRLREMIMALANGGDCSSELSEVWYDIATQRIDAMQQVEEHLTRRLNDQAELRIKQAEAELRDREKLVATLSESPAHNGSPFTMLFDSSVRGLRGANSQEDTLSESSTLSAHKSFYELIRGQSQRIEEIAGQLAAAKQALNEQKVIDRAKLLLMQQGNISEQQAYRKLQQTAMKQNIRLSDLAQRVVQQVAHPK